MNRAAAVAGAVLVVTVALAIGVARSRPDSHDGAPAASAEGAAESVASAAAPTEGAAQALAGGLTRSSEQGAVTVDVRPSASPWGAQGLTFEISMNTHSVPLDKVDPGAGARLAVDGRQVEATFIWTPDAESSGHHVSGNLQVTAAGEGPLVPADASALTLELSGIGEGPARAFQWTRTP
ncbi:MAG: hypothetical protein ACM3ZA_02510 [Bacillota bacterium]